MPGRRRGGGGSSGFGAAAQNVGTVFCVGAVGRKRIGDGLLVGCRGRGGLIRQTCQIGRLAARRLCVSLLGGGLVTILLRGGGLSVVGLRDR